jgi:23S rRNA pseudouridine1911/1915/1917 synthase
VNIPIAYEDEWILVADKPSGLLTIPTPKKESRTLTSILNDDAKERALTYRLHPCHRLDRETSGLIIYAKGKATQAKMMELFAQRHVKKTYIAFVHGRLSCASGEIRQPIESAPAVTGYKTIAYRKDYTIIEATPATGRTNQLRIHCKSIGHPIVGETKFAFRRHFALKGKRLCLHARTLVFNHPVTGRELRLESALPKDLQAFLEAHP